ncbi:MAG: cellulase family glycosylhydrolase [Anaerolineae bacterium]|nr:cellulase family glycosylhydrolase [Anaerolineae bacterium]
MSNESFLDLLTRIFEGKWGKWVINLVVIPGLLFAALWLPPISLRERVLEAGFTTIDDEVGGSVLDPDGTQITILPEGMEAPVRIRLSSVPRIDFLRGAGGMAEAAKNIPQYLEIKSPLYKVNFRGTMPTSVILTVPIPNDAEPHETLDLYYWDGAQWKWLPHQLIPEDEILESRIDFVPEAFAVMQTKLTPPFVSADLPHGGSVTPEAREALVEINPQGLYLEGDGTLGGNMRTLSPDERSASLFIIPTITNWGPDGVVRSDYIDNLLIDPALQEKHIKEIINFVVRNHYSGIDIYYREFSPDLKPEFVNFIHKLADALHRENKILSIRVDLPTQIAEDRWETGIYDWYALGQAVDLFKIPAIPDPRAYAPGGQMEQLLTWATGQVDRYKIQLVVSTRSVEKVGNTLTFKPYTEVLKTLAASIKANKETAVPGEEVSFVLEGLAQVAGIQHDPDTGHYWFSYTDHSGNEHTVWIENATSLARKLQLVSRFNIRGVAFRNLLEEENDHLIWDVLRGFHEYAIRSVETNFAVTWKVQDAHGVVHAQGTSPLQGASYKWQVPNLPGEYTVEAGISTDGGQTMTNIIHRLALKVAEPTPTPLPTPTPRPTPTPTPTPKPSGQTITPTRPPAPPPSVRGTEFGYGIQAHMVHNPDPRIIQAVKDIGFNWIKVQIEWKVFEPSKGNIAWGEMDRIVNDVHGNGLNLLFSIVKAPKWARPPHTDFSVEGPPANPQDYADFVGQVAARYCGRLKAIEVWNEQNINYEWGNEPPDPGRYVQLLAAAYRAIKAACPQMIVVSGALTPAGDVTIAGQWRAVDDINYLDAMYQHGLKHYCDAIGAHPSGYNCPPDGDWRTVTDPTAKFRGPFDNRHHSWCFRGTMEGYRNVMLKYGDGAKKIWATEWGWASVDGLGVSPAPGYEYAADNTAQEQAEWTVRAFELARSWGWAGVMFLWNLNFAPVTGPQDEKAAWSIVDHNWQPRPVYYALKNMRK